MPGTGLTVSRTDPGVIATGIPRLLYRIVEE
jgi:hypothetical protein